MLDHIQDALREAREALDRLMSDARVLTTIETAAELLVNCLREGGTVISCGNGGSMSDAMHFAEELTGRFRTNRPPLRALAISDPSHLTCVANDFGYSAVFSRFVQAHGRKGDTLLAISTSGSSENILSSVHQAKAMGVRTILLTGRQGSPAGELVDVCICTLGEKYSDRVQELHIKVLHILVELIERAIFPSLKYY